MKKEITENLEYLEVYECLRMAHSDVKDIWHLKKQLSRRMLNAVDKVHNALYDAEKLAIKLAYPQ